MFASNNGHDAVSNKNRRRRRRGGGGHEASSSRRNRLDIDTAMITIRVMRRKGEWTSMKKKTVEVIPEKLDRIEPTYMSPFGESKIYPKLPLPQRSCLGMRQ